MSKYEYTTVPSTRPRYSTKGNDAAVYELRDGSFLVVERGDVGQAYDFIRANTLMHGIEIADAWQAWRNSVDAAAFTDQAESRIRELGVRS